MQASTYLISDRKLETLVRLKNTLELTGIILWLATFLMADAETAEQGD